MEDEATFAAVCLSVPEVRGVELRDRNDKQEGVAVDSSPEGMKELVWRQYEIENYLIHPAAILRWLGSWGDEAAVDRADMHMQRFFPPAIYDEPFGTDYFGGTKGKDVLSKVCDAARLRIDAVDYCGIAAGMQRDEIHPEVIEKLDAIAEQLAIADDGSEVA